MIERCLIKPKKYERASIPLKSWHQDSIDSRQNKHFHGHRLGDQTKVSLVWRGFPAV